MVGATNISIIWCCCCRTAWHSGTSLYSSRSWLLNKCTLSTVVVTRSKVTSKLYIRSASDLCCCFSVFRSFATKSFISDTEESPWRFCTTTICNLWKCFLIIKRWHTLTWCSSTMSQSRLRQSTLVTTRSLSLSVPSSASTERSDVHRPALRHLQSASAAQLQDCCCSQLLQGVLIFLTTYYRELLHKILDTSCRKTVYVLLHALCTEMTKLRCL